MNRLLPALAFPRAPSGWQALPLRLIAGYGFMEHGWAKLVRGADVFSGILHALGLPAPTLLAWITIAVELLGGAAVLAGWQMLVGGIPVFIGWALIDIDFDPRPVSHVAWMAVAYSAIVPMIFCHWAWFRIVAIYPAAVAAIGTLAIPVVSVIAASLLKDEPIGLSEILSLGLVLTSLILVLVVPALKNRAAALPEPE